MKRNYEKVITEYDKRFGTEEKEIINAYRKSDSLTKAMVLRTLGLEDMQKKGHWINNIYYGAF